MRQLRTWRPNPWDLTEGQLTAMSVYCETGSRKQAAQKLSISEDTMKCHLQNARKRMGEARPIKAIVKFAVWEAGV